MKPPYRILISPLNWGLGHASRCIPIIRELIALKGTPVLAGDGQSLKLLRDQFPDLEYIVLKDVDITYPKNYSFSTHFLLQFRKMMAQIKNEHEELQKVIDEARIDAVFSDNRYGLYSKKVPCVLITHQLNPKSGFLSFAVSPLINSLINKFDQCWVPDFENENSMAGDLSNEEHNGLSHLTFIGPLSQFNEKANAVEMDIDVLAILSGPEPHRSLFESSLLNELKNLEGSHVIVRGTTSKSNVKNQDTSEIRIIDMADQDTLSGLIGRSKYLVSRSGYSSIMDYYALERAALLVPTKGQREQEYLATYHSKSSQFVIQKESELNLSKAIIELMAKSPNSRSKKNQDLNQILVDFIEALY